MHRLFGTSKPAAPPPSLNDASGSINTRVEGLDQKIKALDIELCRYKDQMKKATGATLANIKKRAMDVLKRKRMYEQQRDQMAGQAFNIEQTVFALDSIKDTQSTVAAMKTATKQLKKENKKVNLTEIENMQDDMEDMLEELNEVTETLGRSYGTPEGLDDADLEAELACLGDDFECGELEQPSYLQSSSALPTEPTALPSMDAGAEAAPAQAVDEYGLPVQMA